MDDLKSIEQHPLVKEHKSQKWTLRPTLLWLEPFSNHHLLFAIGTTGSLLLAIGVFALPSALLCYLTYLSLMVVGEPFLSFQWDALLAETLLLSLFFLPIRKFHRLSDQSGFSAPGRFLILALLAKLMLESGLVKFTFFAADGSNTWRDLTALDYHYWTQPLPHSLSPWVDSLPDWIDRCSLIATYAIELILPFFFFGPKHLRRIAVVGQVLLQIAILGSGNYGFFNLLTLCLCVPLVDDQMLPWRKSDLKTPTPEERNPLVSKIRLIACLLVWALFLSTAYGHIVQDVGGNQPLGKNHPPTPEWVRSLQDKARTYRCFNSYGLFRVMTTTRPEIIIEGSADGKKWRPYQFKWKPSLANQKLRFAGPHMPRIDWQMWFEGLNFENYVQHPFSRFLYGRFLQVIVEGGSVSDFSNLRLGLGEREFDALRQAPPATQQQAIANYNHLVQTFASRSLWFGHLLRAIAEDRDSVMARLSETNPSNHRPRYLKVTLLHFEFQESDEQPWKTTPVPNAQYLLELKPTTANPSK